MATADPVLHDAEANLRVVVRKLMQLRDVDVVQVAAALHIGRQSVYDRLSGKSRFTVQEIAELGRLLDVSPGVFFWSPEELRTRVDEVVRRNGCQVVAAAA